MSDRKALTISTASATEIGTAVALREETKAEKFKRLANSRSRAAIHNIELLGNLSSAAYDYSNAQVTVIEKALTEAVKQTVTRLRLRKTEPAHSEDLF